MGFSDPRRYQICPRYPVKPILNGFSKLRHYQMWPQYPVEPILNGFPDPRHDQICPRYPVEPILNSALERSVRASFVATALSARALCARRSRMRRVAGFQTLRSVATCCPAQGRGILDARRRSRRTSCAVP